MRKQQKETAAPASSEARTGQRATVTAEVEVLGKGGTFSGQTIDLSATGALLWITDERFLPPSDLVNMVVFSERVAQEFGDGMIVRLAAGQVVREAEVVRVSRKGADDDSPMLVGCRFVAPLLGDDWVLLGVAPGREKRGPAPKQGKATAASPGRGEERRAYPRVDRVLALEVRGDYGTYKGYAINVSGAGVLLTLTGPEFLIGDDAEHLILFTKRLGFLFRNGMSIRFVEAGVTLEAELVRVSERSEGGELLIVLGAKFRRTLSPSESALVQAEGAVKQALPPPPAEGPPGPPRIARQAPPAPPKQAVYRGDEPEPRVRILDLMREAIETGASDLHLKAKSPVRLRTAGKLVDHGRVLPADEVHAMATGLMSARQAERYEAEGDLELVFALDRLGRFRVSVMRERGQTSLAIRCIPVAIPTIDDLGISPVSRMLAERPRGLVLVTGPTGSGKSHTLAAMVDHVNRTRACHILTMEDPIEFVHQDVKAHITQREIGRDCADFPSALRRALRHDPDVILVGELRDRETIALALTAAETGHLVFATLHTASASQAPERIVDVFPAGQQDQARLQLSESLQGVLAQILVERVDGGLVPAQEILVASDAVRSLIRERKTPQLYNVIQTGNREGMRTLEASLNEYVAAGIVSYETALRNANLPDQILRPRGSAAAPRAEPPSRNDPRRPGSCRQRKWPCALLRWGGP
ncbi:MAG TPA: PilT/PilU family type 4a pilus ATPase [Planctomycetota bacterium]|nr:PilT/PilU family type 4a pilus ATPase [Planctomycetota bacterium]